MAYNAGTIPSAVTKEEYTWEIATFNGVDFTNPISEVSSTRSPRARNMIDKNGMLENRTGTFCFNGDKFGEWGVPRDTVYGVHKCKWGFDNSNEGYLVHIGKCLLLVDRSATKLALLSENMNEQHSVSRMFNDTVYILDGKGYYQFDGSEFKDVEGFIPTTSIGRTPQGGGQYLYAANLLQKRRINSFLSDGTSAIYQLADEDIEYRNTPPDPGDDTQISIGILGENGEYVWSDYYNDFSLTPFASGTNINSEGKYTAIEFSNAPYNSGYNLVKISTQLGAFYEYELSAEDSEKKIFDLQTPLTPLLPSQFEGGALNLELGIKYSNGSKFYIFGIKSNFCNSANAINAMFSFNSAEGQITFSSPPPKTPLDGWDNIQIRYDKKDKGELLVFITSDGEEVLTAGGSNLSCAELLPNRILGCDIMTTYGYDGTNDRLIMSGNPKFQNWDFISAVNDPTYFPATHYAIVGSETSAIMGYSYLSDGTLAIHKEFDGVNPTIYYREPILLSDIQLFTVREGAKGEGVISKYGFAHTGTEPLHLSRIGLCATVPIDNTSDNERCVLLRSYLINKKLLEEESLDKAQAIFFDGYYCLAFDNGHVYIANTRKHSSISQLNEWQYEWFYFDNMFVTSWFVSIEGRLCYGDRHGNLMYFQNRTEDNGITDDNLYKDTYYDINGEIVSTPIYAEWCTPFSDLGTIVNRKTVKRTNLVTSPNDRTSININVDYIYPFSDTVMPASELNNFSFWTIDFDNFPFDSPSPEVLVVKRKAKKVKLIAFRIWSDTNKRCTLLKFVCTYTIGSKIKN